MTIKPYRIAFRITVMGGALITAASAASVFTTQAILLGLIGTGVGLLLLAHGFLGMVLSDLERTSRRNANAAENAAQRRESAADDPQQRTVLEYDGES